MQSIDHTVDEKISIYLSKYAKHKLHFEKNGQPNNRRRLLGVHLLSDSKKSPIITPSSAV